MIVYFDASALVKRYVEETGSDFVRQLAEEAEIIATAGISRVEVTAALARASRLGALSLEEARLARELLGTDWKVWLQIPAEETVLRLGASLSWDLGLRGYDAVQLASAVFLQEILESPVSFVTFDRQLWTASQQTEVTPLPEGLPALLERWKEERFAG